MDIELMDNLEDLEMLGIPSENETATNEKIKYNKKIDQILNTLTNEEGEIGKALIQYRGHGYGYNAENYEKLKCTIASNYDTMEMMLDKGLRTLFEKILDKETATKFEKICLRLPEYAYQHSYYRRSFKSKYAYHHYARIIIMLETLYFDWSKFDLRKYLMMSEEEVQKTEYTRYYYGLISDLIALEIDEGNQDIKNIVKDILLSDNNVRLVDYKLIIAVARSHDSELYDLMTKLLLAAKLQEGLRQSILETADKGTNEYLIRIIDCILENDLLRFSSCKRAVGTWMGAGYDYSDKRIFEKLLKKSQCYISNEAERKKGLISEDIIEMYSSLWVEGLYESDNLHSLLIEYMEGEKHKKMIALYFFDLLDNSALIRKTVARYINETDLDILAYVFHIYNMSVSTYTYYNSNDLGYYNKKRFQRKCQMYKDVLEDESTRNEQYNRIKEIICSIPKEGYVVKTTPFEWSDKNYILTREDLCWNLLVIAGYDMDEEKIKELLDFYLEYGDDDIKKVLLNTFIDPETDKKHREYLFKCLQDKVMSVRIEAAKIISKLSLNTDETIKIEKLLLLKTGEIRKSALEILKGQEIKDVFHSIQRLIVDKKENCRLGALDLMSSLQKDGNISSQEIDNYIAMMPKTTEQEKILMNSLKNNLRCEYTNENGFGFYEPNVYPNLPDATSYGKYTLKDLQKVDYMQIITLVDSLIKLVDTYKDYTYNIRGWDGSVYETILGNTYMLEVPAEKQIEDKDYKYEDNVLADVWKKWLVDNNIDLATLIKINFCFIGIPYYDKDESAEYIKNREELVEKLFGNKDYRKVLEWIKKQKYERLVVDILLNLRNSFDNEELFIFYYDIMVDLLKEVPHEQWKRRVTDDENRTIWDENSYEKNKNMIYWTEINCFYGNLESKSYSDETFIKRLHLGLQLGRIYGVHSIGLDEKDMARAYQLNLTGKDCIYRMFFKKENEYLVSFYTRPMNKNKDKVFEKYPVLKEVSENIVNRVVEIELSRGDTETEVSKMAYKIEKHYGAKNFAEIIVALGQETLVRGYYYGDSLTKRSVFCELLKASTPLPEDNEKTLKECLEGRVSEDRLLEVAMYVPEWVSIIEKYLKWKGLKSVVWYFHAHTSCGISAEFETEVARYSSISHERFKDGAFDIDWFKEAYKTVGKERFDKLYKCAKYISEGANHRRAQLFSDAVLGRLKLEVLQKEIIEKRNKDKLLCYSLIPLKKNKMKDSLERYEYIQKFLKESKDFGAQRKVSEGKACSIAIENLARNLGFSDILRFTWKMEILKIDSIKKYFEPKNVEGIQLYLHIDDMGVADIVITKDEKTLKAIPTKLKKHKYVEELKEVKISLKEQFKRSRTSLENAMETKDIFNFDEVLELTSHPVIKPLITKLLFKGEEGIGFLDECGLRDVDGNIILLEKSSTLTIAHSYDLFKCGRWSDYQRYAFNEELIQPFKQIFRELYIINEDERKEETISRRYAGHQVQPRRTLALLKNRNWTVDYYEGLQRVYYKENIIATMYALADWFSPSDIEAPTLETVEFFDRKTLKNKKLTEIDPIIFSETMRDIDLIVSVAHVGGVDPLASNSTIEMRKVIVSEVLNMLSVSNVCIEGDHAKVKGSLGEYSIHLGSGIVHKMGFGALYILPVHSQHRGKIFLPFLDEDPRTAEITSKILLLAEDNKIKDPTILEQLQS